MTTTLELLAGLLVVFGILGLGFFLGYLMDRFTRFPR